MRLSSIATLLVALAVILLHTQLSFAASWFFAQNGTGPCAQANPCTLEQAITAGPGTEIACADGSDSSSKFGPTVTITLSTTIDCAGTAGSIGSLTIDNGAVVTLRNFTMWQDVNAIVLTNGTVILDNVHIFNNTYAILAQPTAPSSLIVRNSIIDGNTGGVLLKPQAGGSLTATFDGVTIVKNTGGLKTDTTNGAVRVDVSNSTISNNTANGMNIIGGAGGTNMVTLKNDVIASNGQSGIVVSGTSAAVLVNSTVLDSNTTGATSAVSGGRILTYGNNSTIGTPGSGFTGTAPLN